MKLYIAGPMSGHTHWNFPAFYQAEAELESLGYETVNPARVDEDLGLVKVDRHEGRILGVLLDHSFTWKGAIERDLEIIDECDGIYLLNGWEDSLGARIERDHAIATDKLVLTDMSVPKATKVADVRWIDDDDGETNPKDLVGRSKPQLHLVPPPALLRMAKVMELGAAKYGPYNWREKAVGYTTYVSAALRHLLAALDGQDIDPESGQSHLAHVASCMAILLDADECGALIDDRHTPGPTADLLEELKSDG